MLPNHRSTILLILASCLVLPLASCANSPLGQVLQNSFQADDPSKLQGSIVSDPATAVVANQPAPEQLANQLPADFLAVVPRYPNATLREVVPATVAGVTPTAGRSEVMTRWSSEDDGDRILSFYRQQLRASDWQFDSLTSAAQPNTLNARRNNQAIAIAIQPRPTTPNPAPNQSPETGTTFEIRYAGSQTIAGPTGETPNASPSPSLPGNQGGQPIPSFSGSINLGASGRSDSTQPQIAAGSATFSDLDKTPAEFRQYVQEVAQLGVLTPTTANTKTAPPRANNQFLPNQTITRREFARWLAMTNNRLYRDRTTQQIRQGLKTEQPAFTDVPRSDPDFATIQGLAGAGIIPSRLSGDSTATTFRPNAPLTRETLLFWKVPMDMRQALPIATIDAVKQTWGFQDAARIDPKALRAVLADYQNGDLSNIRRAFGYTTLFQPKKPVTRAEAAAALWYFGFQGEGISAAEVLKGTENEESGSEG